MVEGFTDRAKRAGFDDRTFQTDVELKLRMAGIKVLSEEETLGTAGRPWLYVRVNSLHEKPDTMDAYSIIVGLAQSALLERDLSLGSFSTSTWSTDSVGHGGISDIRSGLKDAMDVFINAWLSVNPKK